MAKSVSFNSVCVDMGGGMTELEILLHYGLYEAVQDSYKDWICEINTHNYEDCVNVLFMLKSKSDSVLASVGKYRVGMKMDDFYKQIIEGLK